jgi:hypothetical protein
LSICRTELAAAHSAKPMRRGRTWGHAIARGALRPATERQPIFDLGLEKVAEADVVVATVAHWYGWSRRTATSDVDRSSRH